MFRSLIKFEFQSKLKTGLKLLTRDLNDKKNRGKRVYHEYSRTISVFDDEDENTNRPNSLKDHDTVEAPQRKKEMIKEYLQFRESTLDKSSESVSNQIAADMLEVRYSDISMRNPLLPIKGEMVGILDRYFVNLITQYNNNKPINVIFLIDTAFPSTYISIKTAKLLNVDNKMSLINLKLHGFDHKVKCDDLDNKLLINANILGVDYFLKHNLNLNINYENIEIIINQSK